MLLKFNEEKIKVNSINYKLSKKTNKLSAFKLNYNHGVETPLMKAKDETEENMQTVTLKKKQLIAKQVYKRIDRVTKEYQFFD